ncbi:hypothetical protein DRI96_05580, partial [Candidatus Aerophobetes bacterium]
AISSSPGKRRVLVMKIIKEKIAPITYMPVFIPRKVPVIKMQAAKPIKLKRPTIPVIFQIYSHIFVLLVLG